MINNYEGLAKNSKNSLKHDYYLLLWNIQTEMGLNDTEMERLEKVIEDEDVARLVLNLVRQPVEPLSKLVKKLNQVRQNE